MNVVGNLMLCCYAYEFLDKTIIIKENDDIKQKQ